MRRINCLRWALVIAVLWPAALCAQGRAVEPSATKTSGSSDLLEFTFLNDWENAVLNGDRGKLTALYTTIPPAQARTPQGNSQDPSEEPAFWSALAAKKYEVPLDKGVPSLAVLDSNGTLLYSQKNGEFESTVRIGPEDVIRFLNRWKPIRD